MNIIRIRIRFRIKMRIRFRIRVRIRIRIRFKFRIRVRVRRLNGVLPFEDELRLGLWLGSALELGLNGCTLCGASTVYCLLRMNSG